MYEHPLTNEHLRVVRDVVGYHIVGPIGKQLACGDVGHCLTAFFRSIVEQLYTGLGAMTVEGYRPDRSG